MMNNADILLSLLNAIETNDFAKAASYLTDDFTFGGAVPQPLNGQQWLGLHRAFNQAFPDFTFNARIIGTEGEHVSAVVQLTGTQTGLLTFPPLGIIDFTPTGRRVQLPQEPFDATVRGNKVAALLVHQVPGGGLPGILTQLGIQMPH